MHSNHVFSGSCGENRQGAILILVALLLPIMLALVAISINIAYMDLCRTELRIATDAAARAGGRILNQTGDEAQALATAQDAARRNNVGGRPLQLAASDVVFGQSTRTSVNQRYAFSSGGAARNSMRVLGHRTTSSADGPVGLIFPVFLKTTSFQPQQLATCTQLDLDVALVIDRSGSMAYASDEIAVYPPNPKNAPKGWNWCDPVPPKSRWLDVLDAVDTFLGEMNKSPHSERISLSTYNHSSRIDVNLTETYADIGAALNAYTNSFCIGGTNIGGGIDDGAKSLRSNKGRLWASKVIVVMTDGIHNTGRDPVKAAQDAAKDNITIFSVTFSDEADIKRMQKVAEAGKGKHFHATNNADLVAAFREIARSLPSLLTE